MSDQPLAGYDASGFKPTIEHPGVTRLLRDELAALRAERDSLAAKITAVEAVLAENWTYTHWRPLHEAIRAALNAPSLSGGEDPKPSGDERRRCSPLCAAERAYRAMYAPEPVPAWRHEPQCPVRAALNADPGDTKPAERMGE